MDQLKNIWNQNTQNLDNIELQKYLEGKLTEEEAYKLESTLDDEDAFTQEAIDGLSSNKLNLSATISELNQQVKKSIFSKKNKPRRRKISNQIGLLAIIVTLLLIVLGYIVIKLYLKN